jgi:hypothetical protein
MVSFHCYIGHWARAQASYAEAAGSCDGRGRGCWSWRGRDQSRQNQLGFMQYNLDIVEVQVDYQLWFLLTINSPEDLVNHVSPSMTPSHSDEWFACIMVLKRIQGQGVHDGGEASARWCMGPGPSVLLGWMNLGQPLVTKTIRNVSYSGGTKVWPISPFYTLKHPYT